MTKRHGIMLSVVLVLLLREIKKRRKREGAVNNVISQVMDT